MGVGTVSDMKILIFVMRGPFAIVALLPLTQNTLPSKDVREYVFSCFLMAYKSRDLPGVILNEFGINLDSIIFLIIFSKLSLRRCSPPGIQMLVGTLVLGVRF